MRAIVAAVAAGAAGLAAGFMLWGRKKAARRDAVEAPPSRPDPDAGGELSCIPLFWLDVVLWLS
jgi:hypothetical protein